MTSYPAPPEPATPTRGGGLSLPAGDGVDRLVRVRLDIAYDGTDFSGWAVQPDRRTVCGVLQSTLQLILRQPVRLTVAGRTDAGVHATGQVAHLDLPAGLYAAHERLLTRRLAGLLPPDVRVRAHRVVTGSFDARFSGLSRSYAYRISDHEWGIDPLRRHDVVHWPRPLDTAPMQAASDELLGLRDFAAYCKRRPEATTIRTLHRLDWAREPDGVIRADVVADAFCHSMVRSLVGALIAVGEGRRPIGWPAGLLALAERSSEITVAPPGGLTLTGVEYPPDEQLEARNAVTRNRRDRD
ncbi:tRNA pseudouridine(38-40) synthase TruA [Cumulibacter manganitolerans]|uniref:tRNA pseudouridine(38-40) synthase TruA n=1 Tax=Cumulibacter manganitolerans TaxID=1884992 RepID=UPI001886290C|nr:tRNA pseudouridine(38-40) synthase TruA [Cumulibacter manganitolerans]